MSELYLKKELQDNVEPNLGQVGDVVQSMLTEAQLQAIRGSGWVLMDGRSVTGTQYESITGNGTIPDARGRFLRSKDNGAGNSPEDVSLGDYRTDVFQGHHHAAIGTEIAAVSAGSNQNVPRDNTGEGLLSLSPIREATTDSTYGTVRQGSETRPKNITINTFIKID